MTDRGARRGEALTLFGEVLLTGLLVLVGSLPVVTVPAAVAAGTAHLRRQVAGLDHGAGRFAVEWWAATRRLWPLGAGALVLAALLGLNLRLVGTGALPGGEVVRWVTLAVAAAALVVLLRTAGAWSDAEGAPRADVGARRALAAGARAAGDDVAGSVLLLVAVGLCATFVWMLLPLAVVAGGLLSMAVVGVEARRRSTAGR
ncbi:hypothetical protein [Puerhibacterium sp. TATVAM-FAB25]|uniref:hypothetical protein n=1 Tax=Puerhibacterium sp. TATVAM-FAB25 TaxID=3093699 RepID=UPI00397B7FD1